MEYDNGENYLKEINHMSILESIDERFDSATSLLTTNAVMYGSTVTALISGQKICGDLDIAVSNQEFMRLCQNFSSSVKWLQVEGNKIPERKPTDYLRVRAPQPTAVEDNNPYAKAKHLPIDKIVSFKTVNNSRIQIVQSKTMTGDRLEDALEVVRKVDFTFCGIAVDMYGRMLEVIPHAYDDCKQRVIRIQDYHHSIIHKELKRRLHKYIKRGWNLTMSIDQAMANLNKAKMEYAKTLGKKSKKKFKSNSLFIVKEDPQAGYILETKDKMCLKSTIGSAVLYESAKTNALREFGLEISQKMTDEGTFIFWCRKQPLSLITASEVKRSFDRHLSSSSAKQQKEKEKVDLFNTTNTYGSYGGSASTSNW